MLWNEKVDLGACSVSNFENKVYAHISFFVCLNWRNQNVYVWVCFIFKTGNATSMWIYFPISIHALKWKADSHACGVSNFEDIAYAKKLVQNVSQIFLKPKKISKKHPKNYHTFLEQCANQIFSVYGLIYFNTRYLYSIVSPCMASVDQFLITP